jgi:hypothetical protein
MAVMIAAIPKVGPPGTGGPPEGGGARNPVSPRPARALPPPKPEPTAGGEGDGGGSPHKITPEAVNYRSEQETCGNCLYMGDDGGCEILLIPVSHGDGCNAFKDKSTGNDADDTADQFEPEEEENEPIPAA